MCGVRARAHVLFLNLLNVNKFTKSNMNSNRC